MAQNPELLQLFRLAARPCGRGDGAAAREGATRGEEIDNSDAQDIVFLGGDDAHPKARPLCAFRNA